jgi:hypothetical protein
MLRDVGSIPASHMVGWYGKNGGVSWCMGMGRRRGVAYERKFIMAAFLKAPNCCYVSAMRPRARAQQEAFNMCI